MPGSFSELGEALLQDPLSNVNNSTRLLAAIRPDADAVRRAGLLPVAASTLVQQLSRAYVTLASQVSTRTLCCRRTF